MLPARPATVTSDIRHFFEYSAAGIEVLGDGLEEVPFGEFLVARGAIDRYQLLCSLQMQDRNPGVRLGECVAALRYISMAEVERHYSAWRGLTTVELQ